jgi:hypothetical protein
VRVGGGSVGGGVHAGGGLRFGCGHAGPSHVGWACAGHAIQSRAVRACVGGFVSRFLAQSLVRPLGPGDGSLVHQPR